MGTLQKSDENPCSSKQQAEICLKATVTPLSACASRFAKKLLISSSFVLEQPEMHHLIAAVTPLTACARRLVMEGFDMEAPLFSMTVASLRSAVSSLLHARVRHRATVHHTSLLNVVCYTTPQRCALYHSSLSPQRCTLHQSSTLCVTSLLNVVRSSLQNIVLMSILNVVRYITPQ